MPAYLKSVCAVPAFKKLSKTTQRHQRLTAKSPYRIEINVKSEHISVLTFCVTPCNVKMAISSEAGTKGGTKEKPNWREVLFDYINPHSELCP